jgi:tripartite-type tricarboxylate transporter receptor subunit TctC
MPSDMARVAYVVAAFLVTTTAAAAAQYAGADYPKRPIRVIVPIAPGGGVDTMARTLAPLVAARLGQPVVVDNRAGGGGSVGAELTAQAMPDGHTVMITSSSFVLHSLLYRARYDPVRDFAPVTQLVQHPYVLLTSATVPASNAREFVSWAKAASGSVNYASSGNGSLIHLTGELFNSMTGVNMVHVPYKGLAQAYPDMFSGQVHATFGSILSSLPHVSNGRLRALGVTSLKRTGRLPEVPTLDESGIAKFDVTQWYGAFAPARTPGALVARLQTEIAGALTSPETAQRIANEGSHAVGNTAPEFARVVLAEKVKWSGLIRQAGIRAE